MGFNPYFLMYRRQPHLPIDVTLDLVPKLMTTLISTKYAQQMRECLRWAYQKANKFHQKKLQCHKQNYDKCSRAVALKEGDTVLVHVTTFKGQQKIQNWWENREYAVKQQPYSNLLVYVVCPHDGEGHSLTLHRN